MRFRHPHPDFDPLIEHTIAVADGCLNILHDANFAVNDDCFEQIEYLLCLLDETQSIANYMYRRLGERVFTHHQP